MDQTFDTLTILAEVITAFVAFSAIIASIRVTWGERLDPFQSLLVQFFAVNGMNAVTIALFPMVLWGFWQDPLKVATYTMWYNLFLGGGYMAFYLRQRLKIDAPYPPASIIVFTGFGIYIAVLVLSLTELFWLPSLSIVAAGILWSLISSVIIFVVFLGTFLDFKTIKARKGKK